VIIVDNDNTTINNGGPTSTSEKLYSLLLRCSHALSRGHHHDGGMHPGQWRILSLLAAGNKVTQRELLDIVQIRAASLSELLTKLESKGLITRVKGEDDRRNVGVEITELGEMVIAEHAGSRQSISTELFSALSEEEQEQLAGLLSKLAEAWHERHHSSEGGGYGPRRHGSGCGHGCHGPHGHHHHWER
jgi:DNA-binding MarR family transcriptional regulator